MSYQKRIEKFSEILKEFISSEMFELATLRRKDIPGKQGIYAIYSPESKLVYVGSTSNLRSRIYTNHLKGNVRSSTLRRKLIKRLKSEEEVSRFLESCSIRFLAIDVSGRELKSIEHFFIAILNPLLND